MLSFLHWVIPQYIVLAPTSNYITILAGLPIISYMHIPIPYATGQPIGSNPLLFCKQAGHQAYVNTSSEIQK